MSSSSNDKVVRRTDLLFKNVDKLGQVALFGNSESDEVELPKGEANNLCRAGLVLRNLNEYKIRSVCGEAVYGAGLQDYLQGRVLEKKFTKDTLSGRLSERGRKWVSSNGPQFFEPTITIANSSRKARTYGDCGCSLAKEGSVCNHMAALMIAWVRNPSSFEKAANEESENPEFEEVRLRVIRSLRELVNCIEKGSSRYDDLQMLQKTHRELRHWVDEVKHANNTSSTKQTARNENDDLQPLIHEFSGTINLVSFSIMSVIETKYNVLATDLYNATTISTFARVLEMFVDSYGKSSRPSTAKVARGEQKKNLKARASKHPARSWDSLVEEFASGR